MMLARITITLRAGLVAYALGGCDAFDYRERMESDAGTVSNDVTVQSLDGSLDARPTTTDDAARDHIEEPSGTDASTHTDGGVIRVGLTSGCAGEPFDHFTFDTGTDGWVTADPKETPTAPTLTHDPAEGSVAAGALRWDVPFTAGNQSEKLRVPLSRPSEIRCVSARLKLAPGGFDQYLARQPGAWSFAVFSKEGCFAQVVTEDKKGWRKDLSMTSVWYELAFEVGRFESDRCVLNATQIETLMIGVATAYGTPSARPATVFVDDVKLYR